MEILHEVKIIKMQQMYWIGPAFARQLMNFQQQIFVTVA